MLCITQQVNHLYDKFALITLSWILNEDVPGWSSANLYLELQKCSLNYQYLLCGLISRIYLADWFNGSSPGWNICRLIDDPHQRLQHSILQFLRQSWRCKCLRVHFWAFNNLVYLVGNLTTFACVLDTKWDSIQYNQPQYVNCKKQNFYEPCVECLKELFKLDELSVIGIMIGARSTITQFYTNLETHLALDLN